MTANEERRPGGNRAAFGNPQSNFIGNNMPPSELAQSPRLQTRPEIARSYIGRGWGPVPIGLGEKAPHTPGWPKLRITEAQTDTYFAGPGNIGVILGEASGGLVDIDLDCPEAITLASSHLPTTDAVFGRESRPRSHWLYRVRGQAPSFKEVDPVTRETLLELRGDGGRQTVFPGSIHPSGETIEWALQGDPLPIEYSILCEAVKRIAAGCLIKRYCPEVTDRSSLLTALNRIDVRVANKLRQLYDLPAASMPSESAALKQVPQGFAHLGPLPEYLQALPKTNCVADFLHEYARSGLKDCISELERQPEPGRANLLFRKSIRMGVLIAQGLIDRNEVFNAFIQASASNGLVDKDGEREVRRQIQKGFRIGAEKAANDNAAEVISPTNQQKPLPVDASPFGLKWHGEQDTNVSRTWLVKNMLPETGAGLLSGQWGTFKTFIAIDLAASVMTGGSFAGHPVKRSGGVLLMAAEGASEVPIRIQGLVEAKYPERGKLPFAWAEGCPTLIEPGAVEQLEAIAMEASNKMKSEFGVELALIIVDTMSAAAGFSDENSSSEGQHAMNVLNELSRRTCALVMACDHFGKAVETGTRGTSAKEAAADCVIACLGEKDTAGHITNTRIAIRKLRSGATGAEIPFTARTVDMGLDEDNEYVTTRVIDWALVTIGPPQPTKNGTTWPKTATLFRSALITVIQQQGVELIPMPNHPKVRAVELDKVREEFDKRYPLDLGDRDKQLAKRRQAFKRSRDTAEQKGLIGCREIDGKFMVWPVNPDDGALQGNAPQTGADTSLQRDNVTPP
jgi:AAA domain/Bifunctional DNA primase/polymerase, N-terminal